MTRDGGRRHSDRRQRVTQISLEQPFVSPLHVGGLGRSDRTLDALLVAHGLAFTNNWSGSLQHCRQRHTAPLFALVAEGSFGRLEDRRRQLGRSPHIASTARWRRACWCGMCTPRCHLPPGQLCHAGGRS